MNKWYEIKALADDEAEVWIYGEIGEDWLGDGSRVDARVFAKELAELEAKHIALRIHSPGGDIFDGQAIYNAIRRHPAQVTSHIDGWAASIASMIALAGEPIIMAETGMFMIHEPFGRTQGTAADHRRTAEILDKLGGLMLSVYEAKSGQSEDAITAAMAAETWYTAKEALEAGFVDEISESIEASALATFDPKACGFRHLPEALTLATEEPGKEDPEPSAPAAGDVDPTLIVRATELLTKTRHGGH